MENLSEKQLIRWIKNHDRFNPKQKELICNGLMNIGCDGDSLNSCENANEIKEACDIPIILARKLFKAIKKYNDNSNDNDSTNDDDGNTEMNDDELMQHLIKKAIKQKSNDNTERKNSDNHSRSSNKLKEFKLNFQTGMSSSNFQILTKKVNKYMTIRAIKVFYIREFMKNKHVEAKDLIMEINNKIMDDHQPLKHYKIKDNRNLIKVRTKVNVSKQYDKKILNCLCGKELTKTTPRQAYGDMSSCSCDICETGISIDDDVYHCPKGNKAMEHPYGYDICKVCVLNNKKQKKSYGSVRCVCNALLEQTYPVDAYPNVYKIAVNCDKCSKKCPYNVVIYHCPKGKTIDHEYGYDLCAECAFDHISYTLHFRNVPCQCGGSLLRMKAKDAYASYGGIICNICGDLYSNDTMIYHCPKNKFITHPQGYDLCETCAKKIRCDCGANLVKTQANMVYSGTGVYCNACYVSVRGSNQIYHCPQQKNNAHLSGFDLCLDCAKKR